jgi:catechol 2,3-dioxygenase-like lactoylglutathione lyase family enzyme
MPIFGRQSSRQIPHGIGGQDMRSLGILVTAVLSLALAGHDKLIGTGRGIDHVGIVVRDLGRATQAFRALGFSVRSGGKHPSFGTENCSVRFKDGTYLELVTYYDPGKAADIARFLERHEGALFVGLAVSSAQDTAATMRRNGFEPVGPEGGTIAFPGETSPPPRWYWVAFKQPLFPDDPLFFLEYVRRAEGASKSDSAVTEHPNTATRVRAAWLAVRNLKSATRTFEKLGLRKGRRGRIQSLGAEGQEIVAGGGTLLLLQPSDATGSAARFVAQRGEAIMGATIEVEDLGHAPSNVSSFRGLFGDSVLIPPSATHGAWIELVPREPRR